MAVPSRSRDSSDVDASIEADRPVTAHETRPGRVVFTEAGNSDGWIATDLTVEPRE